MKKFLCILLAIFVFTSPAFASGEKVNVIVNGYAINDDKAEIVEDRTFVPLRVISEKLGAKVDYNHDKDRQITIEKDNMKLVMNVDKLEAKLNDKNIKLEKKPYIKEDRTMVPLRFISEAFGERVEWDKNSFTAVIGDITGKTPPKDYKKYDLKPINGSIYFPSKYEGDIEISLKAQTEGDVTIISKKLNDKTANGIGVLMTINSVEKPLLDNDHGFNLYYDPETENFITVSYPTGFPKDLEAEIEKIQKEYFEALNTYKPLKVIEGMDLLEKTKDNKKTWQIVTSMKNLFLPRKYFYDNIPYTRKTDDNNSLVYLSNHTKGNEVESKVELVFDKNEKLLRYHMKFYQGPEGLEKKSSETDAINTIKLFQELVLGYSSSSLPKIQAENEKTISIYEKDVHNQYNDSDGNIYVFDMTTGFLEYYKANNYL